MRTVKLSAKHFVHVSHSTGSDDGLWMRRKDDTTIDVFEVCFWEDLDSSAVKTHGKYNVHSGTVDLRHLRVGQALRCYGFYINDSDGSIVSDSGDICWAQANTDAYALVVAECLWRYGAKDVACDVSGNNLRKLKQEARGAL